MQITMEIEKFQPPNQLMDGFLNFAKEVNQKSIERNLKFSEEEMADLFNNSFPGKIRTNFFLWIGDLNRAIEGIDLILYDLSELRNDKNSLKGNPVTRSEFLFQAFFDEFFKIREISKSFIKYLSTEKILDKKGKETFTSFYFQAFNWVYEVRNSFVHQGMSFKDYDVNLNLDFFKDLSKEELEKFDSLIKESNTRENTVEIQCVIYLKFISEIMKTYIEFQNLLNNILADLILLFEKKNLKITVSENEK